MKIRKSGFSYFTFFISAIIFSVLSVTFIADAIKSLNLFEFSFESSYLNIVVNCAIATLTLGIIIGLLFLIRFLRLKVIKKYNAENPLRVFLHWVLFLAILVFGIYFRYINIIANYNNDVMVLLVRKVFSAEKTQVVQTLPYFYLGVVTFVSRFVGLKECVFLWVNLVLEVLAAILFYASFKRLFGRFVALGSIAAFMLLANSYFLVTMNEGYSLLLFFCALNLYLFSFLISARYHRASYSGGHIVWFVILGLLSGFTAYLSIYGLVFWVFMLCLIYIFRPERTVQLTQEDPGEQMKKFGEVINYPDFVHDDGYQSEAIWHTNTGASLAFIISSVIPFITLLIVDAYMYSLNFGNILWENGYFNVLSFASFNSFVPSRYILEIAVLFAFACMGVLAFLFYDTDNLSSVTISLTLFLLIFVFLKNTDSSYAFTLLFFGAYAGQSLDFVLFRKSVQRKTEEIKEADKEDDLIFENIALSESINVGKDKEITLIENVLPGPKKHVKKEMNYAFEPSEENMKFDIEIADDDDFDVF